MWEAQELAGLLKNKGIKVGVAVNHEAAKAIHSDEIPALDSIDRYKRKRKANAKRTFMFRSGSGYRRFERIRSGKKYEAKGGCV